MDEHELEQRLRARLHARFDSSRPSEAYRAQLLRSLTPEAARGGGLRLAFSAAWPVLAAAAVVVIAVSVWALRPPTPVGPGATPSVIPTASPSATPGTSTQPSATPSASAISSPSVVPTPSSAATPATSWTGLFVTKLAGAPAALGSIPWSGGYLGFARPSSGGLSPWLSRDGRAWVALPVGTFGLNDTTGATELLGTAPCGQGLLVVTGTTSGQTLWSSTDGTTWTSASMAGVGRGGLAGSSIGAVAPADTGATARVTSNCSSWQTVSLPASGTVTLTGVTATAHGFVIVGYSGALGSSVVEPLAWYSIDGIHWTAATVTAKKGDGFVSVAAGGSGLVAISTQPGNAPGLSSMWTSTDGRRWATSTADPLGVVTNCAGSGSVAGSFTGDAAHLLVFGPRGGCSGTIQYWTSVDGIHWTKLALSGATSAITSAPVTAGPSLMRDGVLFGTDSGTWFGQVTTP